MELNIRALVLELLIMMEQEQQYANKLIKATLDKYDYLSVQDKAFLKRLFEGCVERRIQLDYVIDCFSKTKTTKMKQVIREALRMGVYQILYMDSVPDSAACNESVKLVVKRGFAGLKGFVNGVLRTISREKEHIPWPDERKEQGRALAVCYSMPEWLVEHFLTDYGVDVTRQILASFMQELPVTVRMDERLPKKEQDKWISCVRESGIRMEKHPYLSYAYRLYEVSGLHRLPGFVKGIFQVQDVSSMLVSEIAGIKPDMTIIDVCAAPGGKSLHAACKLNGTGIVSARDLTDYKVSLIEENVERSGYSNMEVLVQDAREVCSEDVGRADIVYVDAPCSGLGIMGKKCDIRYHMSREQMQEIVKLQREILDTAVQYVKKGGILIYSTCTIHKEENEEQVEYLKSLGFVTESLDAYLPECLKSATTVNGYLQLLPGIHETDGFFMARLRKA